MAANIADISTTTTPVISARRKAVFRRIAFS